MFARLCEQLARCPPLSVILSGADTDRYSHSRNPQDRPKVGIYERFSITLSYNLFARSKLQSNLPFGFRSAQDDARQSIPFPTCRILPHPPSSGAPLTDPPASGSFHREGAFDARPSMHETSTKRNFVNKRNAYILPSLERGGGPHVSVFKFSCMIFSALN